MAGNGSTPGPGWRKGTAYGQSQPEALPSALCRIERLGLSFGPPLRPCLIVSGQWWYLMSLARREAHSCTREPSLQAKAPRLSAEAHSRQTIRFRVLDTSFLGKQVLRLFLGKLRKHSELFQIDAPRRSHTHHANDRKPRAVPRRLVRPAAKPLPLSARRGSVERGSG